MPNPILYAKFLASGAADYTTWLEQQVVLQASAPRRLPSVTGEAGRTHKQVLCMRKDLKMRAGKLAAQAAHASLGAVLSRSQELTLDGQAGLFIPLDADIGPWLNGHFTKIALGVMSEVELRELHAATLRQGIPCALIEDSGLTEFKGQPTLTGLAVGPAEKSVVDAITGHLPLNL